MERNEIEQARDAKYEELEQTVRSLTDRVEEIAKAAFYTSVLVFGMVHQRKLTAADVKVLASMHGLRPDFLTDPKLSAMMLEKIPADSVN